MNLKKKKKFYSGFSTRHPGLTIILQLGKVT